jgi:hypothetical protein
MMPPIIFEKLNLRIYSIGYCLSSQGYLYGWSNTSPPTHPPGISKQINVLHMNADTFKQIKSFEIIYTT